MSDFEMHDLESGFRVGEWWVFPEEGSLRRQEERRHLKPQPMAVLTLLAQRGGEIVSKQHIFDSIWAGAVVEDGALPRCISEIRSALGDDAREPRYIQTLRKRGYRLLLPIELARRADPSPRLRPRAGWQPLAAVGLLLAAALAISWLAGRRLTTGAEALATGASPTGAGPPRPVTAAVIGVTGLSSHPETRWLEPALTAMLTSELAVSDRLRTIPPGIVERMQQQLSIRSAHGSAGEMLARLRDSLGADHLILGTFLVTDSADGPSELRLDLKVYGNRRRIEAAVIETGTVDQLDDLVLLAGLRLRRELGAGAGLANQPSLAGTPRPADAAAARLYFQGLIHLRRFEVAAAIELLQRSTSADPSQPHAYLALARAWSDLGYDTRAGEAARTAVALSEELPREDRLWTEAEDHRIAGRWPEAIERLRELRLVASDNLEYGLELARRQLDAGRPDDAMQTLRELRERAGTGHSDPRIELAAGAAARLLGDHRRALAETTVARELADALAAPLVAAQALRQQAISFEALGRVAEAEAALQAAIERFAAAGDRSSEAHCRTRLAAWLENRGEVARAEALERSALQVFEEIQNRAGEAITLSRLAAHVWNAGEQAEAERMFRRSIDLLREIGDRTGEARVLNSFAVSRASHSAGPAAPLFGQALAIYREIGDQDGISTALINLGRCALLQGELQAALAHLGEAEVTLRRLGLPEGMAIALFNLGYARLLASDVEGATVALEEVIEIFRDTGSWRMLGRSLEALARARLAADDLAAARRFAEESLLLGEQQGHQPQVASSQIVLARILWSRGELAAAEAAAREAVAAADDSGYDTVRERALANLSETLLEAGKPLLARRVVGELATLPGSGMLSIRRARTELKIARVLAATAEPTRARELAEAVRVYALEKGAEGLRMEAELVGLELECQRGNAAAARRRLQELRLEADARGLAWLARRAARLSESQPASQAS